MMIYENKIFHIEKFGEPTFLRLRLIKETEIKEHFSIYSEVDDA